MEISKELSEIYEMTIDASCLTTVVKDSCEYKGWIDQYVSLECALKLLNQIKDHLSDLRNQIEE